MSCITRRALITVALVGLAACSVSERSTSQAAATAAETTVASLRGRFIRRVRIPPERLDADLTQPKVVHRVALPDGSQNVLATNGGFLIGPNARSDCANPVRSEGHRCGGRDLGLNDRYGNDGRL
ncbi:hypothetical protein BH09MYX1_BH09MYX1_46030 [soil metagenome]